MSVTGFLDRAADVATFDKAIESARKVVQAVLRPQAVSDFLHGTWLGHPLHPVLVQVPVGAWTSAGPVDSIPPPASPPRSPGSSCRPRGERGGRPSRPPPSRRYGRRPPCSSGPG